MLVISHGRARCFGVGSLDSTSPVPPVDSPLNIVPSPRRKEHESLIAMIIERTCLYKADLYWYWAHVNETRTGQVRNHATPTGLACLTVPLTSRGGVVLLGLVSHVVETTTCWAAALLGC